RLREREKGTHGGSVIRTREERIQLLETYPNPNLIKKGRWILKSRVRNSGYVAPGVTTAHLIRRWGPGKKLPESVRFGLCRFCGDLVKTRHGKLQRMIKKPPDYHKSCLLKWLGTPAGRRFQSLKARGLKASLPPRAQGRRVSEKNLKVGFSWLVQHCLEEFEVKETVNGSKLVKKRKSYQDIATENRLAAPSVEGRIRLIVDKFPEPQLVDPNFRRIIECILEAFRKVSRTNKTSYPS
ncbi:MAG: hypothetical protein ACE5JU_24840, partial [Candidatus Binatia bacterium]